MLISLILMKRNNLVTIGNFGLIMSITFSIFDAVWLLARDYVEFIQEIGIFKQALSTI